jgi:hypothetical protein
MTLEKPTRGKPVREGVLLFLRSEEMSFTTVNNFRNLIQTYLENLVPSFVFKMLSQTP